MRIRCPHCRHPVEVIDDTTLDDLTCPSCGSNISLIHDDTTVAHMSAASRQVGHFELLDRVGLGSFGAVWKARDTVLDRIVALKIPRRGQLESTEIEYFFRDARAAAQLRHPGIVSVHEVGRDGEAVFIASDYIEGATLHEWISARRLSAHEAADLIAQVADAVHHAHERGVVHRDLKPSNILLDQEGRPHITDFGLAKRESGEITMTLDGQLLGTPAYMSPEQARGKAHEATAASDVYSLGVILFELLTGELPFRGEKRMLLLQILNDEPPIPSKLNGHVPRDLETICLNAMAKQPGQRYAAARDLANDLRRHLAGEPIWARPVGSAERAWRWCRRNATVASLILAVSVSLTGGVIASTLFALRAQSRGVELLAQKTRADNRANEAQRQKRLTEEQLSRAEWLLYANQLSAARREWENGRASVAWQIWNTCRLDRRGWEHAYLGALFSQNQLAAVDGSFGTVRFRGDDYLLGLDGRTARVWDGKIGRSLGAMPTPGLGNADLSPDGTRLVGIQQNKFSVWEVSSGERLLEVVADPTAAYCVAYSPDGALIASTGERDHVVKLWDAKTGAARNSLTEFAGRIYTLIFSDDGGRIYALTEQEISGWDLSTGEKALTFQAFDKKEFPRKAFSAGKRLLAVSDGDAIDLWDPQSAKLTRTYAGHPGGTLAIALSDDGERLISAGKDGIILIRDLESAVEINSLRGELGNMFGVAMNPRGDRLASASDRSLTLWDAKTPQGPLTVRLHDSFITGVAFTPDGDSVVSTSSSQEKAIRVWRLSDGRETLAVDDKFVNCLTVSPDGHCIASGGVDSRVRLWSTANGKLLKSYQVEHGSIQSISFHPDGRRMASAGTDSLIRVWDVEGGGEVRQLRGHKGPVQCTLFTGDGRWLISGGADATIRVWNADTGVLQRTIADAGGEIAVSPDGRRIVAAADELKIWDAASGDLLTSVNKSGGTAVVFSADGRRIVAANGNEVGVWGIMGQQLMSLAAHTDLVSCIALSPDGNVLVSGSNDGTLRVWDTRSKRETTP